MTTIPAKKATVRINGSEDGDVACLQVVERVGLDPGYALIRSGLRDGATHATLEAETRWGFGARVEVLVDDVPIHRGSIVRRHDRGADDVVDWVSLDDRWLLSLVPLMGAIVRDPSTGTAKLCTRYTPRTNPRGAWNCVGCSISGTVWPVFAPFAERARSYSGQSGPWDRQLSDGEVGPWTPARFLEYLYVVANLANSLPGGAFCASFAGSSRLRFTSDSLLTLVSGEGTDGLDDEMPDVDFGGKTLLLALCEALDIGGYYALGLDLPTGEGTGYSSIAFRPRARGAVYDEDADIVSFTLQRSGRIGDIEARSICDYDVEQDAAFARDRWITLGEPVRIEAALTYDPDDEAASAIKRAWSDDEQTAFGAVITGDGTYAQYPETQDDLSGDWLTADGNDGRPLIYAKTREAFQFARLLFPRVWCAYRVDSGQIGTILGGYDGRYSSTSSYPALGLGAEVSHGRPIYREQLQPLLSQNGSDGTGAVRYPVRLTFLTGWPNGDESGVDAGQIGLRVTPDGLIWFDGLADAEGTPDALYEGYYYGISADPDGVTPRAFSLNAAVPADHRVSGVSTRSESLFESGLTSALGGVPPSGLTLSPGLYPEHHQVGSRPCAHAKFRSGTGTESAPLTRLLPPNSGAADAESAALRALVGHGGISHRSRWEMPGIATEWRAGRWLEKIVLKNPGNEDDEYEIGAMIGEVRFDFLAQKTSAGEISR